MYRTAVPLFFVCETPLHAGSGKELGVVDLPIQRERHTKFPKIEASSLKGALRESFAQQANATLKEKEKSNYATQNVDLAFGPADVSSNAHAAALGFTDARLLFFPVKSVRGLFAWVTCPRVLEQFRSDFAKLDQPLAVAGLDQLFQPEEGHAWLLSDTTSLRLGNSERIILEEFAFKTEVKPAPTVTGEPMGAYLAKRLFGTDTWWSDKLQRDLVVLRDEDFGDFVQLSTEVVTRIKINPKTGTVDAENGALFAEEFLPVDSVLYSLGLFAKLFSQDTLRRDPDTELGSDVAMVQQYFRDGLDTTIQLGGDATLGKGVLRTHLMQLKPAQP